MSCFVPGKFCLLVRVNEGKGLLTLIELLSCFTFCSNCSRSCFKSELHLSSFCFSSSFAGKKKKDLFLTINSLKRPLCSECLPKKLLPPELPGPQLAHGTCPRTLPFRYRCAEKLSVAGAWLPTIKTYFSSSSPRKCYTTFYFIH